MSHSAGGSLDLDLALDLLVMPLAHQYEPWTPVSYSLIPKNQANKVSRAEWEFIQNLSYRKQLSEDDANFVKMMYMTKLKKVKHERNISQPLCCDTSKSADSGLL